MWLLLMRAGDSSSVIMPWCAYPSLPQLCGGLATPSPLMTHLATVPPLHCTAAPWLYHSCAAVRTQCAKTDETNKVNGLPPFSAEIQQRNQSESWDYSVILQIGCKLLSCTYQGREVSVLKG